MMCRVLSCPFHQKCNWMFTFIYSPDCIHLFKIVSIFSVWIQRILSFIGLKKQPMVQQLSSSHSYHKDHWMITFFYSLADWIHSFTLVNMFSIQRQRISLYVHWAKKTTKIAAGIKFTFTPGMQLNIHINWFSASMDMLYRRFRRHLSYPETVKPILYQAKKTTDNASVI